MSLPNASQAQIDAMNRAAEEKFGPQTEISPSEEMQQPPVEESAEDDREEETEEVAEASSPSHEENKKSAPSKEDNMRILRERSQKAERERDELLRYVKELQQGSKTNAQAKEAAQIQEDLDDLSFDPDDLAEGKHLMKLVGKIKKLEQKLEDSEKKTAMSTTELRIKRDFPDFEKVASYDNLQRLRERDPDLADAILATPDVYKQHALAYKMVKQMGIYVEDTHNEERERTKANTSKPRPLLSISPQQGDSPLSKANAFANGLTEDLKKQLHREMMDAMKWR